MSKHKMGFISSSIVQKVMEVSEENFIQTIDFTIVFFKRYCGMIAKLQYIR